MVYNVVTNAMVMNEVKKCRYFKMNLGLAATVDKGVKRDYNDKDKFAYNYSNTYKTFIYAQGNVGDIKFYIDHYIKDPVMAVYFSDNFEEFLFDIDFDKIKEKGIDSFLGYILKEVDTQYEERLRENTLKKAEPKKSGNPDLILQNPGAVTYEDLKAYLEIERSQRYKNNNQL
jgi:hypothetical protein